MPDIKVISPDTGKRNVDLTESVPQTKNVNEFQILEKIAVNDRWIKSYQDENVKLRKELEIFDTPDVKKAIDDAKAAVAPLPEEPIIP